MANPPVIRVVIEWMPVRKYLSLLAFLITYKVYVTINDIIDTINSKYPSITHESLDTTQFIILI